MVVDRGRGMADTARLPAGKARYTLQEREEWKIECPVEEALAVYPLC